MQTMQATKTRTVVSVAFTVLAAGSILAGIYYYGNRDGSLSGSAASGCGCDDIRKIVKEEVSKVNSGSSGGSSSSGISGTCALTVSSYHGGGYGNAWCQADIQGKVIDGKYTVIKVSKLYRCGIRTSQVSGDGCRKIEADSLDAVIDSSPSKVLPEQGIGAGVNLPYRFDVNNMRNTCEKIAKDGYTCSLASLSTDTKQASCTCRKK